MNEITINIQTEQRKGQYIVNFLEWIALEKGIDPFYISDEQFETFKNEYNKQ
jgi:hypothetical protein